MFRSWRPKPTCAGCAKQPDYLCVNSPGRSASLIPTSSIGNAAGRFRVQTYSRQWPKPWVSPCMIYWENQSRGGWSRPAANLARFLCKLPSSHAANNRRSSRWPKDSWRCTRPPTATREVSSLAAKGKNTLATTDHARNAKGLREQPAIACLVPPSRQSRCARPTPEDRSPLTWPASARMERRRSKVSHIARRTLHRHPKSPPFPVKNVSKNLQKNLINFRQRFEKNLAKTSKKDDKQNPLTALEVRRAH